MGLALLAWSVVGDAQQAPTPANAPAAQAGAPQPPAFRTGINYVRVDAIVTDKNGNPISDLKQSDFEVTEDNKPQVVDAFKLVALDGGMIPGPDGPPREIRNDDDEEQEASRDDVRLFAIFLDDYHVRKLGSMGVRDPLSSFVQKQLGPSDMIGVMYPLESIASVRMTRNHDAVIRGLQKFEGRKYDYTPRNQFEEQYARYPAETVERIRNQVSLTALRGLITHMGSLKEGRKSLIVVSEGYTNMLPPQLRDPIASAPGFGNPSHLDPMAGQNDPNEDRAAMFANSDLQLDLREVYDTANKNNVSLYMVDPRGLAVSEFDIDQNVNFSTDATYLRSTMDTLRTLAEQTDGRAIVNRNDVAVGMKQIVRDSSAYYLLGYSSTQAPTDGKFHEIKVRVKRPGVQVRARRGYWALAPEDAARALAGPKPAPPKAVDAALAAIVAPAGGRVIRTWIGTSRGDNGKTKVTFVWEPTPPTPGDRNVREPATRVMLTASAQDAAYFRGPARSGTTFDAAPGKVQLRISVEGAANQVLDSEMREITVPDLTSHAALGTPEVLRARTVREMAQLKADPAPVPTAGRDFNRTDRLLVRVPVYVPSAGPAVATAAPLLSVHLLNRTGQSMNELPVTPSITAGLQQVELPIAGLPPGEYIIEIKSTIDGIDAKELVGFRVSN